MIGIIGAMDIEVEGLISAMSNEEEKKISGIVFHSGKIGDKECVDNLVTYRKHGSTDQVTVTVDEFVNLILSHNKNLD